MCITVYVLYNNGGSTVHVVCLVTLMADVVINSVSVLGSNSPDVKM